MTRSILRISPTLSIVSSNNQHFHLSLDSGPGENWECFVRLRFIVGEYRNYIRAEVSSYFQEKGVGGIEGKIGGNLEIGLVTYTIHG